jgi:hypothetical protein
MEGFCFVMSTTGLKVHNNHLAVHNLSSCQVPIQIRSHAECIGFFLGGGGVVV